MYGFGSVLRDYLEFYKISQTEFAERIGVTKKHVNKIINNKADISIELMIAISLITDIDPNIILKLENQKNVNNYLIKKFKNEQNIKEFLNSFYIKEMIKLNWFKPKNITSYVQTSIDLLEYLKIKDFDVLEKYIENKVLYKKKDDANIKKIYLWIKRCDSLIKTKEIPEYNKNNLLELLEELKTERNKPFNEEKIVEIFNKYGIYLVIEEAIKGTKVRGCMMVKDNNPAIYMTKYFKEKASFYFALYHELAHVKTDYNKAKNKIIVDDANTKDDEKQRDKFALNCMIEDKTWKQIIENPKERENICNKNKIPLCFLYSRLAYEGLISYKSKSYLEHREKI